MNRNASTHEKPGLKAKFLTEQSLDTFIGIQALSYND